MRSFQKRCEFILKQHKERKEGVVEDNNYRICENNYDGKDSFHWDTKEEARSMLSNVYNFCRENDFKFSHVCCDGKGCMIIIENVEK